MTHTVTETDIKAKAAEKCPVCEVESTSQIEKQGGLMGGVGPGEAGCLKKTWTCQVYCTIPETNMTSHLKMDGWRMYFLLGMPIFRCKLLVLGRVREVPNSISPKMFSLFFYLKLTDLQLEGSLRNLSENIPDGPFP